MEFNFFEETDWYKETKANRPPTGNEYEFTDEGKEIIMNLVKRAVYLSLTYYLIVNLVSSNIINNDIGPLGFFYSIIIMYFILSIFMKKDRIIKQRTGSFQQVKGIQTQSFNNDQSVDIFNSKDISHHKAISKDQSDSIFSSNVTSKTKTCNKCYGGLNNQGLCDQCDQKW